MLVLIDESGCTGFKDGSSRFFVVSMVVFQPLEPGGRCLTAEYAADVIKHLKQTSIHKGEFHFSKCSHDVRMNFFNHLNANRADFSVYALVVDKENITSHHLKRNPKQFYNFLLKQLLTQNPIHEATIKIDGQKSRDFRKALKSYLRDKNAGMIKKLKFVDSEKDVLIQLADMVCSAINYSYSRQDRLNAAEYKNRLGQRIKNIWDFG